MTTGEEVALWWSIFRLIFAGAILVAWLASIVVDTLSASYDPPYSLHLLMMVVAGALFGPAITGRTNGNGHDR